MCESALVYVARQTNLWISIGMLVVQVVLSFLLIYLMRWQGWPPNWQAAGPAVALMATLALTSVVKAHVLGNRLAAPVSPWRSQLLFAAAAAIVVGSAFTALPHSLEWVELAIGVPAIAATSDRNRRRVTRRELEDIGTSQCVSPACAKRKRRGRCNVRSDSN